jgi:SAM-dependent methyltransferase
MKDEFLYGRDYFIRNNYSRDPAREAMYKQERNRIYQFRISGNVLDVGCGTGDFLASFDDRWNRFGYEPSEYAAGISAHKGIKIFNTLEEITEGTMDVVVMRGTLQHMANPVGEIEQAWRVLKPGGILAILATPNTDSICFQLFGTLPPLDPPRNWVVFGRRTLDTVLERFGFRQREWVYPYWGTPYARPLSDFTKFVLALFGKRSKFAFPKNMMEVYAVKQ